MITIRSDPLNLFDFLINWTSEFHVPVTHQFPHPSLFLQMGSNIDRTNQYGRITQEKKLYVQKSTSDIRFL